MLGTSEPHLGALKTLCFSNYGPKGVPLFLELVCRAKYNWKIIPYCFGSNPEGENGKIKYLPNPPDIDVYTEASNRVLYPKPTWSSSNSKSKIWGFLTSHRLLYDLPWHSRHCPHNLLCHKLLFPSTFDRHVEFHIDPFSTRPS